MTEIVFVVEEAPEGGYVAKAVGASIHTEADTLEMLRTDPGSRSLPLRGGAGAAGDPAPSRSRRVARSMRLPRDVSGAALVAALSHAGDVIMRQK